MIAEMGVSDFQSDEDCVGFADKTNHNRALLYGFLCILNLKYPTLRRAIAN